MSNESSRAWLWGGRGTGAARQPRSGGGQVRTGPVSPEEATDRLNLSSSRVCLSSRRFRSGVWGCAVSAQPAACAQESGDWDAAENTQRGWPRGPARVRGRSREALGAVTASALLAMKTRERVDTRGSRVEPT